MSPPRAAIIEVEGPWYGYPLYDLHYYNYLGLQSVVCGEKVKTLQNMNSIHVVYNVGKGLIFFLLLYLSFQQWQQLVRRSVMLDCFSQLSVRNLMNFWLLFSS